MKNVDGGWKFGLIAFILLFASGTLLAIYFLFSDVIQCVHDWGRFAEDCRQTFFLTILFPFPLIFVAWALILVITIVKFRRKM